MEFIFQRRNQFRIIISSLKYAKINPSPAPCFYHALYQTIMDHGQAMFLMFEAIHQSCQVTESFKPDPTECFGFTFEIDTLNRHMQRSSSQKPVLAVRFVRGVTVLSVWRTQALRRLFSKWVPVFPFPTEVRSRRKESESQFLLLPHHTRQLSQLSFKQCPLS